MGQVSPFVSFGGEVSLRVVAPWDAAPSLGVGLVHVENDLLASADHASIRSTLIELVACPKRFGARETFTLEPCATGVGGGLSAAGRGVAHSSSVNRSYFALGGSLVGSTPVGNGWDVELRAGFLIPLVRRRYDVSTPAIEVGKTPSIGALGAVGVTYSF